MSVPTATPSVERSRRRYAENRVGDPHSNGLVVACTKGAHAMMGAGETNASVDLIVAESAEDDLQSFPLSGTSTRGMAAKHCPSTNSNASKWNRDMKQIYD